MPPTLALGLVLLSWAFFNNRTMGSRTLMAAALALMGWEPAGRGKLVGLILVLVATGAALSVVWDFAADVVRQRRAAARAPAMAGPAVAGPAPAPARPAARQAPRARRAPAAAPGSPPPGPATPMPPVPEAPAPAAPTPMPTPAPAAGAPLTELEQADAFGDLLEANLGGLADAYRSGDVRAQAAFAGEIADVARGLETMLRVVVGERHRVHGFDPAEPPD
jgi:hypothetical protein